MKSIIEIILFLFLLQPGSFGETITLEAKSTLAVVELNMGDNIRYKLNNGREVNLTLKECTTEIIFSTVDLPAHGTNNDASVFKMKCVVNIDGQDIEMIRYVPAQESFYEPYVVNGLRIWFDALNNLSEFYNETHGKCLPEKDARFALQDVTMPICPEKITDWCPMPAGFPDIGTCYRGEDTWLGTYFGTDLHGGLDFNMPSNSPLWTPIPVDKNFYFNTLKAGHNNNRWRALKHWDNGDIWILQTHHLNQLLAEEFLPLQKGIKYAYTAGTRTGYHPHTHFVFKVKNPAGDELLVDPWILFWQILENRKDGSNALKAEISQLAPAETGSIVTFDGTSSSYGLSGSSPDYLWSFGDGGFSIEQKPAHIFQKPGIYPVTLVLFDGVTYATTTQHITINGDSTKLPELKITQKDNPSFLPRREWEMDYYGKSNILLPNSLHFRIQQLSEEKVPSQSITVKLLNEGNYSLSRYPIRVELVYKQGNDWLEIKQTKKGNDLILDINPDIQKMNRHEGSSEAYLVVNDDNCINSPVLVRIVINFVKPENREEYIIDNDDINCIKTNYYWLTNKLSLPWSKCYGNDFLISSGKSENDIIRYYPDLPEGRYEVSLKSPLYEQEIISKHIKGFNVNVKSKNGIKQFWVNPNQSCVIGKFDFLACEGYVEICSSGLEELIIADAVVFKKIID